jgi:hypothetical protein
MSCLLATWWYNDIASIQRLCQRMVSVDALGRPRQWRHQGALAGGGTRRGLRVALGGVMGHFLAGSEGRWLTTTTYG